MFHYTPTTSRAYQKARIVPAGYANEGVIFPPFHSKQYETGVKVDWGQLTTTASLFQLTQPSLEMVGDPSLPRLVGNGRNRNRGLELNAFGTITDEVRILGGMIFYKSDLLGTAGGTENGNKFAGIPDVQLNIGA
jgi:iron complex outermembrane receptor protein